MCYSFEARIRGIPNLRSALLCCLVRSALQQGQGSAGYHEVALTLFYLLFALLLFTVAAFVSFVVVNCNTKFIISFCFANQCMELNPLSRSLCLSRSNYLPTFSLPLCV